MLQDVSGLMDLRIDGTPIIAPKKHEGQSTIYELLSVFRDARSFWTATMFLQLCIEIYVAPLGPLLTRLLDQ